MPQLLINTALFLGFLMAAIALFFFVATRGALLVRELSPGPSSAKAHIYPIYSNMRLIKLIDYQPLISAILLFQYHRLVAKITAGLRQMDLRNRKVLITSCAFGNVIPEVVKASIRSGAEGILVADIVQNELLQAKSKLDDFAGKVDFIEEDATNMQQPDGVVDVNVMFFLLHELPHHLKLRALDEAARMLAPGGRLLIAEFHRPNVAVLRALSWTYFKVFEPYGLALWDSHDPIDYLESTGAWSCQRTTYFFGNFQVISATRL